MGDDFGVGLAAELDALGFEFGAQLAVKFSMMPLCTTAIRPVASVCGWALRSLGAPWVAHRVCPIPVVPLTVRPASSLSRFSIRPAFLATCNVPSRSMTATPAES